MLQKYYAINLLRARQLKNDPIQAFKLSYIGPPLFHPYVLDDTRQSYSPVFLHPHSDRYQHTYWRLNENFYYRSFLSMFTLRASGLLCYYYGFLFLFFLFFFFFFFSLSSLLRAWSSSSESDYFSAGSLFARTFFISSIIIKERK